MTLIQVELIGVVGAHGEEAAGVGEEKCSIGAAATRANHLVIGNGDLRRDADILFGFVAQSPLSAFAPREHFSAFRNHHRMLWSAR